MALQETTSEQLPTSSSHGDSVAESGEVAQWRLMARRFRQSRLAVAALIVLAFLYLASLFAPFLSPNHYDAQEGSAKNAPPSSWTWSAGPAVCGTKQALQEETVTFKYETDCNKAVPVHFFGQGYKYKLFGFIPTSRHLVTVDKGSSNKLYLWGADTEGRDVFARTVQGGRVSLTIGLLGVAISTVLASIIGAVSGYFAGVVDNILQRIIEIILSIPTLPLWATLAAVLPRDMSVTSRFLVITLILSLVAWAGLARQVRGKVMAYSKADYVTAARAAGGSHARIIVRHLIPNAASHIVASAMLAVPVAIIAETSLSFLGIGMLPPAVSWGVLLKDAQQVSVVAQYPWMLLPAAAVVLAVTCFLLIGDGVRDAVDPYG